MPSVSEPDTPSWLDRILKQVDQTFTPIARDLERIERREMERRPSQSTTVKTGATGCAIFNFVIASFGLVFSIVNAVFLSNVEDECKGYNAGERKFLYAASIVMAILFGMLTLSSILGLQQVFRNP
jgi:hypothetical protein